MGFSKRNRVRALSLVLTASLAHEVFAQVPAPPSPTLWSFLGFPRTGNVRAQFVNRRGNLPGLEKKPPLKNIADPANLAPEMPKAIQEAAKIKQAEDLAPQKIKAIKYLGKIGCGCYPGVKEGLLAALDDCTEDVRYEAIQAFMEAAGNVCNTCSDTCCDADVIAKLNDMATGMDENGCFKEPSARVRAAAAQAAQICEQRVPPPMEVVPDPIPQPERGRNTLPPPVARSKGSSTLSMILHPGDAIRSMMDAEPAPSPRPTAVMEREVAQQPSTAKIKSQSPHRLTSLQAQPPVVAMPTVEPDRPAGERLKGSVAWVGPAGSNLRLHFPNDQAPAVGEELRVYHDYLTGRQMVGRLQVVGIGSDGVWARPLEGAVDKIASGDDVVTLPGAAVEEPVVEEAIAEQPPVRQLQPVKQVRPVKLPAKQPVAIPRAPSTPAVQVSDEQPRPLSKAAPAKSKKQSTPVVQKHLPPRTVSRPAAGAPQGAVPRLFEAPRPAASSSRPLPVALTGRVAPPPVTRTVAQAPHQAWLNDGQVATASDGN
jgi:hypothetical protein